MGDSEGQVSVRRDPDLLLQRTRSQAIFAIIFAPLQHRAPLHQSENRMLAVPSLHSASSKDPNQMEQSGWETSYTTHHRHHEPGYSTIRWASGPMSGCAIPNHRYSYRNVLLVV